jgi:hypothetical protein
MVESVQAIVLVLALSSLGYGLWLISPAAMFIGMGVLLLSGIVASRLMKDASNVRRNS